MNRHRPLALWLFVLSGATFASLSCLAGAAVPETYRAAAPEGLVSVPSRMLDEVYLRPSADFVGYRKVMIDPVQVSFRKNWRKDQNSTRDVSRWISQTDADEILRVASASFARMVADEFTAKGFEIVASPGAGVMRVTPTATDLDVYEPDVTFSRPQALFTQDAGTATLRLEARDSDSGALLGVVIDRGTATQVRMLNRTNQTSNLFWFDAMFRLWAANCIAAIQSAPVR
jgi:hypothetical protein